MNKSFVVKDLRNEGGATIDFVAKHKKKNFSLFFKVTEETHEATLCGFEGDGCFRKLFIPDTLFDYQVTRIGNSALECCEMTSVVVPPTVNAIDDYAFSGCFALKNIEMPETIVSIGEGAFQDCENLRKIPLPNSLLEIGENAFSGCSSLSEITIPKTVVSIGREAFWGCKGLTSIAVHNDNKVYDSRENCNAIISTADDRMVVGCTKAVIPNSVRIIEYAFAGQSDLESMTIPTSVVIIGECAFCGCKALKEIIIPNSVKTIGKDAFARCSNLREISIPCSVIEVESRAFGGCENLSDVTIPRSVKSIAINSFEDCPRLLPYPIEGGNPYYDYKASAKKTSEVLNLVESIAKAYNINLSNKSDSPIVNKSKTTKRNHQLFDQFKKMDKLQCVATSFDRVINSVFDDTRPSNLKDFNAVFFKAMKYYTKEFFDLGYVRFLNIFNDIPVSNKGSVGYFADFVRFGRNNVKNGYDVVTNRKERVCVSENNMFNSTLLLDELLSDSCAFGKSVEYCCGERKPLLPVGFTVYKDSETGSLHPTFSSKYLFPASDLFELNVKMLKPLLRSLENCYNEKYNCVTNYCILFGSPNHYRNSGVSDNALRKTAVRAIVGIDCRKEDKDYIVGFLHMLQLFLEKLSFYLIVELKNYQLRRTAVIASVAQVMARNMSHNIGSHVFSNLISNDAYAKLTDRNIFKAKAYVSPWDVEREYPREQVQVIKSYPGNFQLSYFNQYLKSRMDYLSEVTFGIPNMLTTKYIYSDVFKELDRVKILLNYISGIPGFKYTFSLKRNGEALTNENDIAIAFPSDVLGNQAFYNIIENVIRNTAKHAFNNEQQVNTFTIEFADIEDYKEYYSVEIDNGITEEAIDDLVRKQNERINTSVLDKENNLRSRSLGMLEMKASAAFLRQVDIAKVDSYDYQFDDKAVGFKNKHDNLILLKAINKNGALGYRFLLQKPKEFLFVGEWDVNELRKKELLNCGIRFIEPADFVKAMEEGTSFAHPFLLYHENVPDQVKELLSNDNDCKTLLPVRKMKLESKKASDLAGIMNSAELHEVVESLKVHVWTWYFENEIIKDLRNKSNKETIIVTEFDGFSSPINNQVVFLNHATKSQHEECWQLFRKDDSFEGWIENLSSRTSTKLPEFSKYSNGAANSVGQYVLNIEENKPLNYVIFEAYHNKVLVLDERVQKFSKENSEGSSRNGDKIPCSKLFESTHVLIPDTPLDPNAFDEEYIDEIEQFIEKNTDNAYILIHYGILERMYRSESVITEKLCTWAKGSKRLVVTSGRGAHSLTLPPSVCFANLSSVLYAFTENRNKYIINNLLNQSRRKNE